MKPQALICMAVLLAGCVAENDDQNASTMGSRSAPAYAPQVGALEAPAWFQLHHPQAPLTCVAGRAA